jgi:hypothetical protein
MLPVLCLRALVIPVKNSILVAEKQTLNIPLLKLCKSGGLNIQ